ncbi:MAG: TIM barrel protein [bacterium]
MKEVYISSIALNGYSLEEIIFIFIKNGWALEFSSGIEYFEGLENFYINSNIKRMPHNYFPAPKNPFVLNLASNDEAIRLRSVNHCINGLKLAKKSESPFFAAHAGFCIDPQPKELGKKILIENSFNREKNKDNFLESIFEIMKFSNEINLPFLIENNVISQFNLYKGENPFLCCDSDEIDWIYKMVNNDYFGILLDTAHLKVSCNSLKKNAENELLSIQKYIKGIHHSDNDGIIDNNLPISNKYWFLPFLKMFSHVPHVIEVKNLTESKIKQQLKYFN